MIYYIQALANKDNSKYRPRVYHYAPGDDNKQINDFLGDEMDSPTAAIDVASDWADIFAETVQVDWSHR